MKKTFLLASILAVLSGAAYGQTNKTDTQGSMDTMTMSGPGMMGQGMMMNCPMMRMMGSGNPHTEGRLAFLKTELKITDSQTSAWTPYADVVREIDKKNGPSTSGMMGSGMMSKEDNLPAPDSLKRHAEFMAKHLDALKKLQAATEKLYSVLDADQKKTADELLSMTHGMGPM